MSQNPPKTNLNPAALGPLYEAAKALDNIEDIDDAIRLAETPSPVQKAHDYGSPVIRYNPVHADAMVADDEGSHVLFTDYAALSAELAEVRGVLAEVVKTGAELPYSLPSEMEARSMAHSAKKLRALLAALALAATVKGKP